MEKYYFALGMLSMVAVIIFTVIVWGILKVVKTEKKLNEFQESYRWDVENNHRRYEESRRDFDDRIENFSRSIQDEFKRVETLCVETGQESKSYTDKRFDKVK
jgi:biopolymer transport protein ExbB/TolQ